jgi:hypothetical protein
MALVVVDPQSVATMTWMRSGVGGVLADGEDGVDEAACGADMSGAGYLRRSRWRAVQSGEEKCGDVSRGCQTTDSRCNSCATHVMLPRRSKYLTSTA